MNKLLRWIAPKKNKFFEMLKEQSENVLESARELSSFVDDYSKFERSERKAKAQAIKKIEHKADELNRAILHGLDKNFAAPIEKEYIRDTAVLLNDAIALINATASRFVILSIERIDENIIKLVRIIYSIADELNKGISNLKKFKDLEEHCKKINELEKEAKEIYHEALSELFHFYKNSIDIMKYKDIYGLLENINDKCKRLANVMERISAKYA